MFVSLRLSLSCRAAALVALAVAVSMALTPAFAPAAEPGPRAEAQGNQPQPQPQPSPGEHRDPSGFALKVPKGWALKGPPAEGEKPPAHDGVETHGGAKLRAVVVRDGKPEAAGAWPRLAIAVREGEFAVLPGGAQEAVDDWMSTARGPDGRTEPATGRCWFGRVEAATPIVGAVFEGDFRPADRPALRVRQHYLNGGGKTFVVTFTEAADRFAASLPELESLLKGLSLPEANSHCGVPAARLKGGTAEVKGGLKLTVPSGWYTVTAAEGDPVAARYRTLFGEPPGPDRVYLADTRRWFKGSVPTVLVWTNEAEVTLDEDSLKIITAAVRREYEDAEYTVVSAKATARTAADRAVAVADLELRTVSGDAVRVRRFLAPGGGKTFALTLAAAPSAFDETAADLDALIASMTVPPPTQPAGAGVFRGVKDGTSGGTHTEPGGFSIDYPPGWIAASGVNREALPERVRSALERMNPRTRGAEPSAMFLRLDGSDYPPNVGILSRPGEAPLTAEFADRVSKSVTEQLGKAGVTLSGIKASVQTVAGKPALVLDVTVTFDELVTYRQRQHWFVGGGRTYLVVFSDKPKTFETNLAEVDRILQTVRVPAPAPAGVGGASSSGRRFKNPEEELSYQIGKFLGVILFAIVVIKVWHWIAGSGGGGTRFEQPIPRIGPLKAVPSKEADGGPGLPPGTLRASPPPGDAQPPGPSAAPGSDAADPERKP
jgi:hypothetical protein